MAPSLARVLWPPLIAVSGRSGSGKTLLIEQLVPRLQGRSLRVGVIKDCHHAISADTPGKDSDRLFRAGADVLACGPNEAMARFRPEARPWGQWVRHLFGGHDVVLAEGFREEPLPRISVRGEADAHTFLAISDALAQADEAADAVWGFLRRTHRERPVCRLAMSRAELLALLAEEGDDAGACEAALGALRRRPGVRLIIAAADDERAGEAGAQLLAHGGPGVDVVRPSSPEAAAVLLEPSVQVVLEEAADGDREAWQATLAGPRTRHVETQARERASG
jgi:molybdopterin-guanine dinucleotide biosynthesis protein MobB